MCHMQAEEKKLKGRAIGWQEDYSEWGVGYVMGEGRKDGSHVSQEDRESWEEKCRSKGVSPLKRMK